MGGTERYQIQWNESKKSLVVTGAAPWDHVMQVLSELLKHDPSVNRGELRKQLEAIKKLLKSLNVSLQKEDC